MSKIIKKMQILFDKPHYFTYNFNWYILFVGIAMPWESGSKED